MNKQKLFPGIAAVLFLISLVITPALAEERDAARSKSEGILNPASTAGLYAVTSADFSLAVKGDKGSIVRLRAYPRKTATLRQIPPGRAFAPIYGKKKGSPLFSASLITLAALNVADYLTTRKALTYPGLREGNPLMKNITKNALVFAGIKLGVAVCDAILLKKIYRRNKTLGWVLSTAANIAMTCVVAHNMRMIQRARGL